MDGDNVAVTYANAPVDKVNRNNDVFPNGFEVTTLGVLDEGANSNPPWNTELTSETALSLSKKCLQHPGYS